MDREMLLELAPHYVVMLALVFLVLAVVRAVFGEQSFWIEFGIIVVVVFLYRPGVKALGVAPSAWE